MSGVDLRLAGLKRFATAISVLTILGHGVLGFEQAYAHVLVALLTTYLSDLVLEAIDAKAQGRRPRWSGGATQLFHFLLPAHITGLAVAMLLYPNERLGPIVVAALAATGSKYLLRAPLGNGSRHFLNPSNTGICTVLLLYPWVGIAPPYQFTENISGAADWVLLAVLVSLGTFLNARFTKKLPLIAAWVAGFFLQAYLRSALLGTPLAAALNPMTGIAFLLFTFYMVTDPGTTPSQTRAQVLFGASVAAVYGILMVSNIVFGLFFSLFAVCSMRGIYLHLAHRWLKPVAQLEGLPGKV